LKDRPKTVSNRISHIGDKNQLGGDGQNSGQKATNKSSIFDPVENVIAVTTTKSLGKFFYFAFCFNPNVPNFMERLTSGPRYLQVRKRETSSFGILA